MFEFDKYDPKLHAAEPEAPREPFRPADGIEKASLLFWGEHCIECAAPACYQSCDLYDPRRDGGCRRFEYGFAKNRNFASPKGFGAEIVFKKWGKLEAPGNTHLVKFGGLRRAERCLEAPVAVVNNIGTAIWRMTGKVLFPRLSYAVLESYVRGVHRKKPAPSPDAFLIEIYNPGPETVRLHLNIWSKKDIGRRPPPHIELLEIPTGYFRRDVPAEKFAHIVETGEPFNVSIIPADETTPHIVVLTLDFVTFVESARAPATGTARPAAKCVVFDLDNTLWDGVLIEDANVTLRPDVVEILKTLDERGILLSIASKNPHDLAWEKLGEFGLQDYFLHPAINWSPKSHNIKGIAERLNIGLDTFIFVDDQVFERDEVATALPAVETLDPDRAFDHLLGHERLRGSTSSEARNRRRFYQESEFRESVQADFGDYIEFLRSCEIVLEIRPFSPADQQRTAELVQRTNQLNFSGQKYDREQLAEIVSNNALGKWVLSCSDKFGSYGTIGFCVSRNLPDEVIVEDLMLSCRIQGKFIEQALFKFLMEQHPVRLLRVNFKSTERNGAARAVMTEMGLDAVPEGFVLDAAAHPLKCDFIRIRNTEMAAS